jgi:hypothetical protein
MKMTFTTTFTMTIVVIALGGLDMRPSMAAGVRPWCEYGSMFDGSGDCSYATLEQCRQTARGDGECERNPRFDWHYFTSGHPAPVDADPVAVRCASRITKSASPRQESERMCFRGRHSDDTVPGRSNHERMIQKTMPYR